MQFIQQTRPANHPYVAVITIDRPPVNAMSLDAHRELMATLRSLGQDPETRYHVETCATAMISTHPDSKEAVRAFKEKRPGRYPQPKD